MSHRCPVCGNQCPDSPLSGVGDEQPPPGRKLFRALLVVDGEVATRGPYQDEYQAGRMGKSHARRFLRNDARNVVVQPQRYDTVTGQWVAVGSLLTDMTAQ